MRLCLQLLGSEGPVVERAAPFVLTGWELSVGNLPRLDAVGNGVLEAAIHSETCFENDAHGTTFS
jgi:hypothetical protein